MAPRALTATLLAAAVSSAGCGALLAPHRPPPIRRTVARPDAAGPRTEMIGYSVHRRRITAVSLGSPTAPHPLLLIGDIHGDEPAGIAVARWLIGHRQADEPPLWVIPDVNPDGVAADTRQNAHGVDLNRNFPYRWATLYRPGDQQYQGPRPLSEPESRAVERLIVRLAPRVTVWFHQPLGLVDLSGGDPWFERRFAVLTGLPVRELTRYPGSAPTWQNHAFPGSTAFVVELPPGRLRAAAVTRLAHAVLILAGE
jgi:protein MpaA